MMGDLSWPCASSSSTFWSNCHDDLEEKFYLYNSISTSFNPVQALHIDQQLLGTSNSQRAFSSLDYSNQIAREEALLRWEDIALGSESSSPSLFNKPCTLKPLSGLASHVDLAPMATFSSFDDQPRDYGFLCGSKSYADASVDEDGVSIVLSGESESYGSKAKNAQFLNGFHQNSADQQNEYPQEKFSDTKICSRKRTRDQIEVKNTGFDSVAPFLSTCDREGGFRIISENSPKRKKQVLEKLPKSTSINFQQQTASSISSCIEEPDQEAIAQMKEMIYRAAAFRPVNLGLEAVEKPKRKNVRISTDPQTVAARQRRERIGERIRVLQRLVPGGSKMDTASMLDEAANYLKFLKSQIKALENLGQEIDTMNKSPPSSIAFSFNPSFPMQTHFSTQNPNHIHSFQK